MYRIVDKRVSDALATVIFFVIVMALSVVGNAQRLVVAAGIVTPLHLLGVSPAALILIEWWTELFSSCVTIGATYKKRKGGTLVEPKTCGLGEPVVKHTVNNILPRLGLPKIFPRPNCLSWDTSSSSTAVTKGTLDTIPNRSRDVM